MGRLPCCEKAHTNKGAWTEEEDQRLIAYIRDRGEGSWRSLPKAAGLARCGKSCRLRWINYLRPDLKRGKFTNEEEGIIIKLHALLGNKWSLIAGRLPGRTDNEIKNYWNTHIKRKLLNNGVNPQTHCPLSALPAPPPPTTDNIVTTAALPNSDDYECSIKHVAVEYTSPTYSDNTSTVTVSPVLTTAICLCYDLGFSSSEACGCQFVQEQHAGLKYRRSIEIEERDFFS